MDRQKKSLTDQNSFAIFAGGGEMGELTRTFDWSNSPLGPATGWPQSLRIAIRIMLDSRYAMWLGWGPELTFFYNDAYAKMTLGPKHPWALGRSAREVWKEIWSDIGPRAEKVIATGEATWDEGLLLFLERHGFPEETYHTFSYSPIPNDQGRVGGMLCVVTEDTERTIGERRLRTLRELAARTTEEAKSAEAACETAAKTLGDNPNDVPFALVYLLDDSLVARRVGRTGVPDEWPGAPASMDLSESGNDSKGWPLFAAMQSGKIEWVADFEHRFGPLRCQPWMESPHAAIVVPIAKPGQSHPVGFLIMGISPRLVFSDDYKGFVELITGHVATAIANARAHEEERKRVKALAEIDRAKTAFFSNVSHEFRTPLTLMLGPVEDLLARSHTDLPPAAAGQLEVVNRNGIRLLRLVNSLLDFSRIEAGRVRAVFQATDLGSFTTDLASNFRSACERAGLQLRVDCPSLVEPVFVDREMWEKIVLNLISNAFKFTFEGEIGVSLAQNGNQVELHVRDTGTGIAAEEMPRLFERFHRIEKTHGRTNEGSGIGLALVQELVKLHGGSVAAHSTVGKGTTFVVSLPLGSGHLPSDQIQRDGNFVRQGMGASPFVEEALRWLPDEEREEPRVESSNQLDVRPTHRSLSFEDDDKRPLVLVADDNADMRHYIATLLADQFRVRVVPDGEAALEAVTKNLPDLILSDVMMPKLNGFGLLRELRSDARTSGVPIILLSARAGEESRVDGMQAGADDYLVKPFSAKELLARVSAHLQIAQLRREATQTLRESEERFRALVNATADIVYRMSPDWTELRYLDGKDFIADTNEPSQTWLQKYIHVDDHHHVMEVIHEAIRKQEIFQLEHRVLRKDGTVGWTFSRAIPLVDANGELVEWFGAASDVTSRKLAEEKLRQSEERLRVTLASIGDAVITTDVKGCVTFLNNIAESLTEWSNAEAVGQALDVVFNIINEQTRQAVESPAKRPLEQGVIVGLANHTILIGKNKTERTIDDSAAPVRDGEGRIIGCVLVFRDVTERRLLEKRAKEQSEAARKLAAIVDSSDDAIVSKTLDGIIQSWNASAERIFGYTSDEAIGQSITMLFPPDRLEEEDRIIAQIRSGERLQHFDTVRRRKDGMVIQVSLTISPVKDDQGQIIGVSKIARDITQRKQLEEELRQVAAELSEANRQKDEFLATLSHELRNPLAPIRNALELMSLSPDPETISLARNIMERQLSQMVRLVDDLMDLSRITRGKVELKKERVQLANVITNAVETSLPLVNQMEHDLTIHLANQPVILNADPTRLSQVFANLLNNAAKYSERGGRITIIAELEGNDVVVKVRDSGIGIPVDKLNSIFDMFQQVERSMEKSQGGLGIGLTLVKRLIELHAGSVEAKSDGPGLGAEFIVRLPMVTDDAGQEANQPNAAAPKLSMRILIVDDNRDGADSLAMMLRVRGNEVTTAYDGEEGVAVAAQMHADVVLLDIGLPKLNGYEAARRIKERLGDKAPILVAITGWGQEEDRRRSRDAGFDYHLIKPVEPHSLINLLSQMKKSSV